MTKQRWTIVYGASIIAALALLWQTFSQGSSEAYGGGTNVAWYCVKLLAVIGLIGIAVYARTKSNH